MQTKAKIHNRWFGRIAAAAVMSCCVWSVAADPYSTAILADGPVAFWRMNETTGTVATDSAGTFNGVYTNASIDQTGYTLGSDPTNLAVAFGSSAGQGSDSYVGGMPLDFATGGTAVFSLEAWVNGSSQVPSSGIVGKGAGGSEECYLDCGSSASAGAFRFFVRNAANTVASANSTFQADGAWHHLVGVCDQSNGVIRLYIDGQQVASASSSGGIRTTANANMNIGARQQNSSGSYNFQFNGYINQVAVYNYALSPAQVQNHYFVAGIPPTITLQPTNALTVNEGSAVTLAAAAYGSTPLSYQWLLNSSPIFGQTNAVFSTNSIPASYNNGTLTLQVTNAYGQAQTSGTFLTVNSGAPQFPTNLQPAALTLYTGNTFTYSVTPVGTVPFYYQWYRNSSPINSATNSSYAATTPSLTDTYYVTVSNTFGGGSITQSVTVSLTGHALPSGTYATQVHADHPVAYWRLDDATNSSTAGEYEGGHTGTYNSTQLGLPGYSPLDSDTAAGFGVISATDSYVSEVDQSSSGIPLLDFAAANGVNAEFSVECWVNGATGQNPSGSCIVSKGISGSDEFVLDASTSSGTDFRFYTRKATGGTSIINSSAGPDSTWHHLVAVCDEASGITALYIDGALNSQITGLGGTGLADSSTPLSIGSQNSGFDYSFNWVGAIDEVSVYNYALSSAQVQAHYGAAQLPPYFTQQPPTNISAVISQPVTLSATALGSTPMTNQWFSNSIPLTGQTNVSLSVNTSHSGTNAYFLKVSNAYGNTNTAGTVVSIPAGSGPPALVTDTTPVSSTRYTGLPLTFSVVATGSSPLTYQWYSNNVPMPGATNTSFTIASLQLSSAASYNCIVSNSLNTVTSTPSVLSVIPAPTNAYPSVIIADHPVAYFRLDEPSNSPSGYDYVGGNVGQYTSLLPANFPQCGWPGYDPALDTNTACKFGEGGTGVNNTYLGNTLSNIDFSVPNGGNGTFSIEAWINGTAGANQIGGGAILAKGRGSAEEQFSMDINNGIRFYVRNASGATLVNAQASPTNTGAIVSGSYQMDGKWHHVVGVCDQINSNLLMYLDGHLIGPNVVTNNTVPPLVYGLDLNVPSNGTNGAIAAGAGIEKPTTTADNETSVSIGNRNKSSAHTGTGAYDLPFVGLIDEVALYNYVLTPNQVLNHYNTGAGVRVPLAITNAAGKTIVTWFGSGLLQSSTNVSGPYNLVPGATSPYTNNATGATYYRLKLN